MIFDLCKWNLLNRGTRNDESLQLTYFVKVQRFRDLLNQFWDRPIAVVVNGIEKSKFNRGIKGLKD